MQCNGRTWQILAEIPENILETVTIQFPDPWFKKKHAKRRMVKDKLVETVVKHLKISGKILFKPMLNFWRKKFLICSEQHESLREIEIEENPLPVKTEREISVENRDLPVYRRIFEKIKGESYN